MRINSNSKMSKVKLIRNRFKITNYGRLRIFNSIEDKDGLR